MKRPYVICHMMSTVDGRIISNNWGSKKKISEYSALYEECHNSFKSQAWMVGRVTMEAHFSVPLNDQLENPPAPIPLEPFVADKKAKSFAIAVDARGKLGWKNNKINGDHIIAILSGEVGQAYLHYLRKKKVSYIFGGEKEINFLDALQQLKKLFPIKTIMLEGGGNINGSLLNNGLIDELSLLIIPVADGTANAATTFDITRPGAVKRARPLQLKKVKQLKQDVLWLKYQFKNK